jgi:membrane protein implicated in regulation of membrane protease activity
VTRSDRAAPGLLLAFFAATLVMVVAVVLLLQDPARWVDFAAVALLVVVAGVFLWAIVRVAGEGEGPDEPETRP